MSNSELFIKLYVKLETAIKKKYGEERTVGSVAGKELSSYRDELITLKNIRNILSHSKTFGTEYCLEPHSNIVDSLKNILALVDDSLLINNCVRIEKIAYAEEDDKLLPKMNAMKENIYTHIPILNEKKAVCGVFGESTLFSLITDRANKNERVAIDSNTTFADISQYTDLFSQKTETFYFMGKYDTVLDAKIKAKEAFNGPKRRLGMIFITENGRQDEPLLGLLTVWGILGRETFTI